MNMLYLSWYCHLPQLKAEDGASGHCTACLRRSHVWFCLSVATSIIMVWYIYGIFFFKMKMKRDICMYETLLEKCQTEKQEENLFFGKHGDSNPFAILQEMMKPFGGIWMFFQSCTHPPSLYFLETFIFCFVSYHYLGIGVEGRGRNRGMG